MRLRRCAEALAAAMQRPNPAREPTEAATGKYASEGGGRVRGGRFLAHVTASRPRHAGGVLGEPRYSKNKQKVKVPRLQERAALLRYLHYYQMPM